MGKIRNKQATMDRIRGVFLAMCQGISDSIIDLARADQPPTRIKIQRVLSISFQPGMNRMVLMVVGFHNDRNFPGNDKAPIYGVRAKMGR
jgi:hypothetical protein